MIPLRLNEGMIHHWRAHGYTHLHYGAICLALTLHGRKGLPVVARVALLDTRYKEYQHACIATIQTTLNVGTVFVTLFPNFNVALEDPQIYQNMQIQLQITGAPQIGNTYAATLHHQMAYRVQNHAMDLSLPRDTEDALLIQLESQHSPSCIHIPRQIPREELVKLLPESWVTNYEKLRDRSIPIQSVDSSIHRRKDGAI
ncbi:Viral movement protein, partial [Arabidopsis suecica]